MSADDPLSPDSLFQSAFEFAAIGMALVSPEGKWLRVNRSVCKITGYREAELLERTFQDITHPEDLERDLEYVGKMLAGEIHFNSPRPHFGNRSRFSFGCAAAVLP